MRGGLPNPAMFPFTAASVTLSNGEKIDISGEKLNHALQVSEHKFGLSFFLLFEQP